MSANANTVPSIQTDRGSWLRWGFLWAGILVWPCTIVVQAETPSPGIGSAVSRPSAETPGDPESAEGDTSEPGFTLDFAALADRAARIADSALLWYRRTPPGDRVSWGGLAVCSIVGLSILLERLLRLRERRIIPSDFTAKFLDLLHGGKLDAGRALDYCEENPSPAARVALAAVRRWGRPAADLERAVALAHRVEADKLRRNVGTLRRVAALTPLLGFLGTVHAASRTLAAIPAGVSVSEAVGAGLAWGPELASALAPLTAGLVIATLAIVTYDGLAARIERLTGALDRLGAETIDAIAMMAPAPPASLSVPTSRPGELGADTAKPNFRMHPASDATSTGIFGLVRPPHPSPAGRRVQRLSKPRSEGNTSAQA